MTFRPALPHVKDANILFLDTETGGLSASRTDIIEFGCILTDPSGRTVLEEWEARVVPTRPVEPDAARINGYNAEKWASEGISLATAMTKVLGMARGAVMCCHNAPFDKAFVEAALALCRLSWTGRYHTLCTVSIAQPFLRRGLVENVKLETLARYFGVPHTDAHRALPDAKTCRAVYLAMMDVLEPAIDTFATRRARPSDSTMRIIVNGASIEFKETSISYEEIVNLSGLTGSPSVAYCSKRDGDVRRDGTMYAGCSPVLLTDVMVFTVAHTGSA